MTDSKHTNDNNSLFTRIQVKSPCADERYSAGNSFARLMTRIHADAVNKARPERNYTKAYRIWLAAASLMIVFLTSPCVPHPKCSSATTHGKRWRT